MIQNALFCCCLHLALICGKGRVASNCVLKYDVYDFVSKFLDNNYF